MHTETISVPMVADAAVARTRAFLDRLLPPPRDFAFRLWDGTVIGGEDGTEYTIVLSSPGTLRRMFGLPIELTLGEAYFLGDFDIEGDLGAALGLKDHARAAVSTVPQILRLLQLRLQLPRDSAQWAAKRSARLSGETGSRGRDRRAIQHHYDVGNDFYQLWLDERMIYSCAYFPSGREELARAQELKLDMICRKLRLQPGERLLDIGCGWGGFCIHAVQNYGVTATGVTLSDEQFRLARERVASLGLADSIDVRLLDYRDLEGEFDKVVSIGMFEHVRDHREYFGRVHELLRPGGLFLNHSIAAAPRANAWQDHSGLRKFLERRVLGTGLIRDLYVFPDGNLRPLSEANLIAEEAGLEIRDVENLREHYALTLRRWNEGLEARQEDAVRIAGEPVYRIWRIYMAGAALEFERGNININQTLFARPIEGRAGVPFSREDLYRAR